jgi:hypothetical protein
VKSIYIEDESNKQSLCSSQCRSCGGHERPAGDLQVESCHQISAAKCQEPSQVRVSGQEPFSFNFCNGYEQSKRGETEAVRGVFEDGHVLELLGSQLNRGTSHSNLRRVQEDSMTTHLQTFCRCMAW